MQLVANGCWWNNEKRFHAFKLNPLAGILLQRKYLTKRGDQIRQELLATHSHQNLVELSHIKSLWTWLIIIAILLSQAI